MEGSLTDAAIERLLRDTSESELDELNDFVLALKERSLNVDPEIRFGHVALAAAAAREAAGPARRPVARVAVNRRRRLTLASLTSGLSLKLLLGAAALAAVGTGAAVTGVLPEPAAHVADSFTDPRPVISLRAEPEIDPAPASSHEPPPAADHGLTVSEQARQEQPHDCATAWELAVVAAEQSQRRPEAPPCAAADNDGAGSQEAGPHEQRPAGSQTPGPPERPGNSNVQPGPPDQVPPPRP